MVMTGPTTSQLVSRSGRRGVATSGLGEFLNTNRNLMSVPKSDDR